MGLTQTGLGQVGALRRSNFLAAAAGCARGVLVKDDGARAQPMGLSPPDGRDTMVRAAYGARQGGLVGERGDRLNRPSISGRCLWPVSTGAGRPGRAGWRAPVRPPTAGARASAEERS